MLKDRNRIIYLQMTLIGLFVGILFSGIKMYSTDWGNCFVNIWGKQITINDLWYYNCQNAANMAFSCTVGAIATYCSELNKNSVISFIVKYLSVFIALVFISSFFFGLLFYNNITIFEEISFVLLLIYTTFRAVKYYRNNIKVHGTEHIAA